MSGRYQTLSIDQFVRSIAVNANVPHNLFLGAGCSILSGLPSASSCVWDWKRAIFLSQNPGLTDVISNTSIPSVRTAIQGWLDQQGRYPPLNSAEEYSAYAEACYPIASDRRAFFQRISLGVKPSFGYKLTALMAANNLFKIAWSTNFDGLLARASAEFSVSVLEAGIDTQGRLDRPLASGELLNVYMHGDYRYDNLKNTSDELKAQEQSIRQHLITYAPMSPLIVLGYSGRDESVMSALISAYSRSGAATLYWCGYGDGKPPRAVDELLQSVVSSGNSAYYVVSDGFEDTQRRLALACLRGTQLDACRAIIAASATSETDKRSPWSLPEHMTGAVIKSNAFRIELPSDVFEFSVKIPADVRPWKWLSERTVSQAIVAVPLKNKILAYGDAETISQCFSAELSSPITRVPMSERDLSIEDGAVNALVLRTLLRRFSEIPDILTDERRIIWTETTKRRVKNSGKWIDIFSSAVLSVRLIDSKPYLIIKPSILVRNADGSDVDESVSKLTKQKELSAQRNAEFNSALEGWRKLLFPSREVEFTFPGNKSTGFRFTISGAPLFSKVGLPGISSDMPGLENARPYLQQYAVRLKEPPVIFRDSKGVNRVKDEMPLRGILQNHPYDYPITTAGLNSGVRLGVISFGNDSSRVKNFLDELNATHRMGSGEPEYVLDYPGFAKALKTPIEVPIPGGKGWVSLSELSSSSSPLELARSYGRAINQGIDALRATGVCNVIVINVPARWDHLLETRDDSGSFNLHHFVKAYGVQSGIGTQFIRDKTLSSTIKCRIWWWLALAFYVKSMRTPWVLDCLDASTAYAGIGFSVDRYRKNGDHILLGCSHLYDSNGEGLQYRLTKIDNPIVSPQGNPFMSRDDARRMGENILQLYYEAKQKVPDRVVIHKSTPFRREESEGLREGLGEISQLEFLEVRHEDNLRYLASFPNLNGRLQGDRFPISRGTLLRLERYAALLWVHGAAPSVTKGRNYYQGKRRIPAPLYLKRYSGTSDLVTLGTEILGLSKMVWNTLDYYTQVPATLYSSREIARIGSLLERYSNRDFDYRLFI